MSDTNKVETTGLNSLFHEIIDSEKKAKEKKIETSNLRQEIDKNAAELSKLNDRRKEIGQEIESNRERLVLAISDITIADNERQILANQLDQFRARHQNTAKELDAIKQKFKDETETFISKAYTFCQRYAMNGEYYKERKQIIEQISSLEKDYAAIELVLSNKIKDVEYYQSVDAEKKALLKDITVLETKNKLLVTENSGLESNIARLSNEISALRNAPNSDQQFLSLKRKIEVKESQQTENRKPETQKEESVELENANKAKFTTGLTMYNMNQNSQSRENIEQINNNSEQLSKNSSENNSNKANRWENSANNSLSSRELWWKQYQQRHQLILKRNNSNNE